MKIPWIVPTIAAAALLAAGTLHAERNFTVNSASATYRATLSVKECDGSLCQGKGTVRLFLKKTGAPFQTLSSNDLFFFLDGKKGPTANVNELYGEQSPLIFGDFNFDGTEDLAVRNGNNSQYGGPSYDVYVYHSGKKQFVPSADLTMLATENLGMFEVDRKRKRLITRQKSGCCWHLAVEYAVVPRKGLVKVREMEEDAQNGEVVTVKERNLVDGKWVEKVTTHKISDYYGK